MSLWQQWRAAYLQSALDAALRRELELERRLAAAKDWSRSLARKVLALHRGAP